MSDGDQVIQPVPRRKFSRGATRSGFAAPSPASRQRLLKKLGMPARKTPLIRPAVCRTLKPVRSHKCDHTSYVQHPLESPWRCTRARQTWIARMALVHAGLWLRPDRQSAGGSRWFQRLLPYAFFTCSGLKVLHFAEISLKEGMPEV